MVPILLAAALLQASGTPPGTGNGSVQSAPDSARPALDFSLLPSDYPASSLRNNEQGTTAFTLIIGPDGRVSECHVTSSSGFAALDQAACRAIRERAIYAPARDAAGRPVTGRDSGRVTWRLPSE